MEIKKPLHLTDEQRAQLELHSFLNILHILMSELSSLKRLSAQPDTLDQTTRLTQRTLNCVMSGQLDRDDSVKALEIGACFSRELEPILQRQPAGTENGSVRETVDNVRSILKVLGVRLEEFQRRMISQAVWQPHDINQLAGDVRDFFTAVERNSKGRFRVTYNIAAQEVEDYLVHVLIESVDGRSINMPPVLHDVFRDLLANARKYTPPGGRIDAGMKDDGRELRLVVEDTGCGIPSAEVEHVVDFGYRASNARPKPTHGGGFGLTKAYSTTQQLGGRMWIEPGRVNGTRVVIRIPCPPATADRGRLRHLKQSSQHITDGPSFN